VIAGYSEKQNICDFISDFG